MGARQKNEKRARLPFRSAARQPAIYFCACESPQSAFSGPLQFAPAPRTKICVGLPRTGRPGGRLCIVCHIGGWLGLQRRNILFDSRDGLYVALYQRRVFLAVLCSACAGRQALALGAARLVFQHFKQAPSRFCPSGPGLLLSLRPRRRRGIHAPINLSNVVIFSTSLILPVLLEL